VVGSTRRGIARACALLIVIGLLLAACSDDSGDSSAPGGSTQDTAAARDVDPNGVIKVGIDLQSQAGQQLGFDPTQLKPTANAYDGIWHLVYGRLMIQNADGSLTPDLAESATIVDTSTIEVVLRDDLTFSDGTPLDAAALKISLETAIANRATNEPAYQAPFFALQSVTVVDPTTARLTIGGGTAASWYDAHIATWQTSIIKPSQTDWTIPIGGGPMVVDSFQPGQSLVMSRSETYWNADEVKLAGYEFVQISNEQPQSGIAALRTGQVDVTITDPTQLADVTGQLDTYARVDPNQTISMHICKKDGPLADAKFRAAVNKGIDRAAINEAVYGGLAEPATQLWPTGHKFNDPDIDDDLAYDVDGAKQLLQEAGYAQGATIDLHFIPFFGMDTIATVIKDQMQQIGVEVNIVTGSSYVTDFLEPNAPGLGLYNGGTPGVAKLNAWVGDGLGNVCDYSNLELTALYDQLRGVSQSEPEAVQLWHDASEIVVGEALGGFVFFRPALAAYDIERVGDMQSLVLGTYIVPDPMVTYVKAG
jgi:peptide/nickel transport system substrate-binding protein